MHVLNGGVCVSVSASWVEFSVLPRKTDLLVSLSVVVYRGLWNMRWIQSVFSLGFSSETDTLVVSKEAQRKATHNEGILKFDCVELRSL